MARPENDLTRRKREAMVFTPVFDGGVRGAVVASGFGDARCKKCAERIAGRRFISCDAKLGMVGVGVYLGVSRKHLLKVDRQPELFDIDIGCQILLSLKLYIFNSVVHT